MANKTGEWGIYSERGSCWAVAGPGVLLTFETVGDAARVAESARRHGWTWVAKRFEPDGHVYVMNEAPLRTRAECAKTAWHGSVSIVQDGLPICGSCNTRVTAEDDAWRMEHVAVKPRPLEFEAWLTDIERHYVVPPANCVRVVVSERPGINAYVSIEDLCSTGTYDEGQLVRRWSHREGSAEGCGTLGAATARAKALWQKLVAAATMVSS